MNTSQHSRRTFFKRTGRSAIYLSLVDLLPLTNAFAAEDDCSNYTGADSTCGSTADVDERCGELSNFQADTDQGCTNGGTNGGVGNEDQGCNQLYSNGDRDPDNQCSSQPGWYDEDESCRQSSNPTASDYDEASGTWA